MNYMFDDEKIAQLINKYVNLNRNVMRMIESVLNLRIMLKCSLILGVSKW